ncbi:MAG: hypothetical protein E7302_09670 [Butyrivibrio sp.]|jgi:hypothetical protein|nr:hypothetical protein [Butyrivibrio sp.]MBR4342089.1 hypothetical protein [Lachnospiraceae bacterium]
MAEKMLVTQALDERDLLVGKITDKINKASFIDTIKPNEDKVFEKRVSRNEFAKNAESAYQQIQDLIDRYQKIDAAIVASNANTMIKTSYGEYTVAGAIALRKRLKSTGTFNSDANFEYKLMMKIESDLQKMIQFAESKNKQLQGTAENMRLSILGKDSKVKDDKPLEVVNAYVKENTTEVVDPLDAQKKADALKEKRDTLLTELDTQIKVSNATTFVEI